MCLDWNNIFLLWAKLWPTYRLHSLQKPILCALLLSTSVVSNSVWPHRWQPTRLSCPWDSPGKNTGVGCHFLLQCMKVNSESEVTQLCQTLHDPMDYRLPGSSVHGIFQARVLEWVAIAFSQPLLIRALIPFMKAPPLWPNHLPKVLTPNTITVRGVRCSAYEFWGDAFSP